LSLEEISLKKLLLGLLLLQVPLYSQNGVDVSVSNLLRYGTGTRYGGGSEVLGGPEEAWDYFENLTDTRIGIADFYVGFRLLHDAPPEYGKSFTGIRKRFVEFRKEGLYLRAGDSFSMYGRGLALNVFENRTQAYDTGIDGIKAEYQTDLYKVAVTGGTIDYLDVQDLTSREHYSIRAGSAEVRPIPILTLGFAFVSGKARLVETGIADQYDARFDIPDFFTRINVGAFDLFASYAENRISSLSTTYPVAGTHKGSAFYVSTGYVGENFGVSLEYKDYRFGVTNPSERIVRGRPYRAFAFQNMPIVHKEHSFTLLSRYPHVADFNDEVGSQLDVFFTPWSKLTGSLNVAMASRHFKYTYTGWTDPATGFQVYDAAGPRIQFFPYLSSQYSPFWEVYGDLQYFIEEGTNDYAIVGFNRRSDEITTGVAIRSPAGTEPPVTVTRSTGIPLSVNYNVYMDWVVKATVERQWVLVDEQGDRSSFANQLFSVNVSKSPTFSVGLRHEFTSDEKVKDGRRFWTAIDVGFRLSTSHTITLTAGADRGGTVCSAGVCRIVPPFSGVRVSILSYL
jgi:hypothetical protein